PPSPILHQKNLIRFVRHNLPLIRVGISNAESRQPGKAPNFSVNWAVGDTALEVINTMTGKDDMGRPSRLCKHILYSRWLRLYGKLLFLARSKQGKFSSYHETKQAANEYQDAKQALIKEFQKSGLGMWVKKPIEQDHFTLSI
uniref:Adenosine deaminase RNA specific B1b n=1 Tax=Callorhinchus milii TaxID=7868 RepID=A0A4W3H9G8_CALMI